MIMASQAYQDGGAITLWWDETEGTNFFGDGVLGGRGRGVPHTQGTHREDRARRQEGRAG